MTVVASGELLERADSLSALNDAFAEASSRGPGQVALVSGEAGIGKTALLRRFCGALGDKVRVLWAACDPLFTPRPLGPLLDIGRDTGGALQDRVESGAKPHDVAGALLGELSSRRTTVVVLEDIHWADEATLDVIRVVARRLDDLPALLLVSYREEELHRVHPLRIVLGELRGATRIELGGLSPEAVTTLAGDSALDAGQLHDKTGGNPFFITEVLAAQTDHVPPSVRDAVLSRAARLNAPTRELLDAVSVVPQRAEVWLLEALTDGTLGALDDCLASGMLRAEADGVAFRHELARLSIEESLVPDRAVALHRRALSALSRPAIGKPDFARLAHHAEAAGDAEAVLRFAPAAAEQAAAVGSHREAVAQYARALRFADGLGLRERAGLLERLSDERFVLAQHDEAIAAVKEALECYRQLGDRRRQADALCTLSRRLYCPGRGDEASADPAREALAVLADEPPCRELARAYALMAAIAMNREDASDVFEWGPRAVELAERLGERDLLVYALNDLGTMEYLSGVEGGRERLERSLELALAAGFDEHAGRAFIHLAWVATRLREYGRAADYIREGIDYCAQRDLEIHRHYLFTRRSQMELGQGLWSEAAESVLDVIGDARSSPDARAPALAVLALVRARRGDPDSAQPLEQAVALLEGGADLQRIGPVVAAQAEILWLERRFADVEGATRDALDLALQCRARWVAGELAYWRWQAGARDELGDEVAEPFALSLAGDWAGAAERWRELGCPYEAALALADSDDEAVLRQALDELQALGARPAAAIVARRLRERGARGLPRGPRPRTRQNAAGLTVRELEVLPLVAEGLRNAQIAQRLVISEKTVDHHVSAILRKLGARTRGEAVAEATRLGVSSPT